MGEENAATDEVIESAIGLLSSLVSTAAPASLSAARYLARLPQVEQLGRLVDALRVTHAAEAENRIASPVDSIGAAGYASAKHAVAQLTGVSEFEAARRIRIGGAVSDGVSLSGAPTSPRYPEIAGAVSEGRIGIETADVLVRELDSVARRCDPVALHTARASSISRPVRRRLRRSASSWCATRSRRSSSPSTPTVRGPRRSGPAVSAR